MRVRWAYFQGLATGLTSNKDNQIPSKWLDKAPFLYIKWIYTVTKSCCPPTNFTKMEDEWSNFDELICTLLSVVTSNHRNNAIIGFVIHENL